MSKARKNVQIVFLLDQTGSMMSCKQQTIDGFNEYLDTVLAQSKKSKTNMTMTLTLFNARNTEIRYADESLDKIEKLNQKSYLPAELTPLYDAIGISVSSVEESQSKRKKKDRQDILFVVQTDGFENFSKEYTREQIFDLVKEKEKESWTFVYIGADQDAWAASAPMGFAQGNTMNYKSAETRGAFGAVAVASVAYAANSDPKEKSFFEDEDKDA